MVQGRTNPSLLVLAPTRELSVQILEEAQRFGRPLGIRSVCCYGGAPKYPQIAALDRGVECVIATPGRLNDLLEMRKANLSNIQYLVLDEAGMLCTWKKVVFATLSFYNSRLTLSASISILLQTACWTWALNRRFVPLSKKHPRSA
jgi:superfamily II DNA/RNA helicase